MSSTQPPPSTAALEQHLLSILPPSSGRSALCTSVLPALLDSIAAVADALRASHNVGLAGGTNAFGDDQLNVDVAAEDHIRAALARCPSVATASSEEDPVERSSTAANASTPALGAETYTVAFDPLDGSSIIAPNWTVGTIVGVWDGLTALGTPPTTAQIASVLGVYGPRTTAVLAVRVPGYAPTCVELALAVGSGDGASAWTLVSSNVRFADAPSTRYFAPANARAAAEDARYRDLIAGYLSHKYTLRYSGGLVPDVVHMLVKGHGVYLSPITTASRAKLRRLYELCPVALVLECAGGSALDSATGAPVLTTPLANTDERGGLLCGTPDEVVYAAAALLGGDRAPK